MSYVNIIAHRGANRYAPQNTLPAFEKAMELGADGFETDVHLTKDAVPVICHNYTVNETSNGMGNISSYTLEDLKKLDFGSYYDTQFKGVQAPTLDEFLELVSVSDISVMNIEIKAPHEKETGIVSSIIDAVKAHNLSDRLLISSFDSNLLTEVKEKDRKVRTGYLYGMFHFDSPSHLAFPIAHAKRIGAYAVHPMFMFVNERYVKAAHREGIKVNVWTVNDEDMIKRMIRRGVDGIITDCPDRAMNILRTMGLK